MQFKTFSAITLFTIAIAGVFLTQLCTTEASTTVLSVEPTSVADPALHPGSVFRVNITLADVQMLFGFQFALSYDTTVLTATNYGLFMPIQNFAPSEISDPQGYVAIAAYTHMGDPVGFSTTDPWPVCWIEFLIDSYGYSTLDLHDSLLADVLANPIPHVEVDGFFSSPPPPQPVPEFPIGLMIEIALAPLLIYLYWKRNTRTLS
jgi:hypothetical protein